MMNVKKVLWAGVFCAVAAAFSLQASPLHADLWRNCTRYKNGNLLLTFGNDVSTLSLIGPENYYGGFILAQSPWQEDPILGSFKRDKQGTGGTVTYPGGITLKVIPGENEDVKFLLHIPADKKEKIYLKLMWERFQYGPTLVNGKALSPSDSAQSVGGIREMIFNSNSSERGFRIAIGENTGSTAFYTTKAFCADIFPLKGEEAEFTVCFVPEKTENAAEAAAK